MKPTKGGFELENIREVGTMVSALRAAGLPDEAQALFEGRNYRPNRTTAVISTGLANEVGFAALGELVDYGKSARAMLDSLSPTPKMKIIDKLAARFGLPN